MPPPQRLAFVYRPDSFPSMSIAGAAENVCDMIWVVDSSDPDVGSMPRLLRRLGSVVDVAGMSHAEAAEAIKEARPDGILALADNALIWTAEIAVLLGLPFVSPETARRLTDKHRQRQALGAGGLPVPGFWAIASLMDEDAWDAIASEATFPAVLKPRIGDGSRNTYAVSSLDEVRSIVGEADSSAADRGAEWVLEEYIRDADASVAGEGFAGYVSVESFVVAGKVTHLAITGRTPPAVPFRETGFFIPSALRAEQRRAVLEAAESAVTALGVSIGCLHTEIKLTPSGPVVIEVNGRIGGGVPEMMEASSGVRFLSIAMRLALGEVVAISELPPTTRIGYLLYVQAPATLHKITSVEGLAEVKQLPGVSEIMLKRGPGQPVDWRDGNQGHVFSVLGVADDHEDLRRITDRIWSLVRIDGE